MKESRTQLPDTQSHPIRFSGFTLGGGAPLVLIAGPCVIVSKDHTRMICQELLRIAHSLGLSFIFKASYDKANRSSHKSYRGPGMDKGLKALAAVRKEFGVPILTDVHTEDEIAAAAEVADVLQIPAFLCRQTDFVMAVAKSGKIVNVKKGQFLAPWDMKNVVEKIRAAKNEKILLTERGASFGYNNLVADFRSLAIMRSWGYPVCFDATHSVQLPGGQGSASGGQREFVAPLSRAAVAVGVDALFLEVHEDPEKALSDGPNSIPLDQLAALLRPIKRLDDLVKSEVKP